ncbi:ABC transporter permease [Candidatus Woesearchaeota archaeon]|nr:ABC transporter permease [Candidatus Woesearchaeota archaeon]
MKLHRIKAMLLNYYYFSINSMDRIFDMIYWPVLDILIWGFVTYYISGLSNLNVVNAILGAIVLWVFIWRASQDIVVYLLESYWSRSVYYLFSSPVKSSEVIASLCILGLIRGFISFAILNVLAFVLYQFNIFNINLFHITIFITLLTLLGWGLGILVSSSVFIFGSRVQVLAWSTIWIFQPFSCVFYPLNALPPWAANISKFLPTTHVFEGLRASINNQPLNYASLIYALVVTLLFLIFASVILAISVHIARKKGSFAKPE